MKNKSIRSFTHKRSLPNTSDKSQIFKTEISQKIFLDDEKKEVEKIKKFKSYSIKSTIFSLSKSKKLEIDNINFDLFSKKIEEIKESKVKNDRKTIMINQIPIKDSQFFKANRKNKTFQNKETSIGNCLEKLRLDTLTSHNLRLSQNNMRNLKGSQIYLNKKLERKNISQIYCETNRKALEKH